MAEERSRRCRPIRHRHFSHEKDFSCSPLPSLFPFLDLEKAAGHGRRRARTNELRDTYACVHVAVIATSPSLSFSNVAGPSKHVRQLVDRVNKPREIHSRKKEKKLMGLSMPRVTSAAIGRFLFANRTIFLIQSISITMPHPFYFFYLKCTMCVTLFLQCVPRLV